MRILLTGGTDLYGHSLMFLFLRDGTTSESVQNTACDRALFHAQLRPCLDILMNNTRCSGISVVADFRDIGSVDHLNAIVSSLVICQNELGSNISICYFMEPSSRQLRRALCRFVKCGNEESKNQSAFKIPFQVLLFSGTKGLKDHIKSNMLPEELGGTLLFDEVSYLLQIAVFDTLNKLKTSIAAMHSFIESAASGDVLDGDVSACLEQFSQLREQAFGLYSHLKNAGFDRFDPFPIFRKLFAEGDALHSLATQIRAVLVERQHRLNAFSTLCTKLGEGERLLSGLEIVLNSPDSYPSLMKEPHFANEESALRIEQFFATESGSSTMSQFLCDLRYLLETALLLNEDPLGSQLKAGYDLDALFQQINRVDSLYSASSKCIDLANAVLIEAEPLEFKEQAIAKPTIQNVPESLEVEPCSSNSPCPLSSSSMSRTHSDSTATSFHNKAVARTPSFSEVSPVGELAVQSPAVPQDAELDSEFSKSPYADAISREQIKPRVSVSVSIQTEAPEPLPTITGCQQVTSQAEQVKSAMGTCSSSHSTLTEMASAPKTNEKNVLIVPNRLTLCVAELAQLVSRFETRASELRQSRFAKSGSAEGRHTLAEMRTLLAKLTAAARRIQEQSEQGARSVGI